MPYEVMADVELQGRLYVTNAESHDLIQALNAALRQVLLPVSPVLAGLRATGFRVRIHAGRDSKPEAVRAAIDSRDVKVPVLGTWSTVGECGSVVDAVSRALQDAMTYRIIRQKRPFALSV